MDWTLIPRGLLLGLLAVAPASALTPLPPLDGLPWNASHLLAEEEHVFFTNLHQLTFEGENAEAYWHPDGTRLIFQRTPHEPSTEEPNECDQIFELEIRTGTRTLLSTGTGRTTCAFFIPGTNQYLFSSTHAANATCPARPDYSLGYVWPIYPDYDIWVADRDTQEPVPLIAGPGYAAEGITDQSGTRLIYTAFREGDLNLFVRDLTTGKERQVTHGLGYDGGGVFSPDGSRIAWRAHYPETDEQIADYQGLLAKNLIRPSTLDLYVADVDGSNVVRVTDNGAANFAPVFTPDGTGLVYSSNLSAAGPREFELFYIDLASREVTQLTFSPEFDGFPMFSYCGNYLAFCSNRGGSHPGNTNVFIAEWRGIPNVAQSVP